MEVHDGSGMVSLSSHPVGSVGSVPPCLFELVDEPPSQEGIACVIYHGQVAD